MAAVALALAPAGAQAAIGPFGPDFRISFMGPDGDANYDAEASNVAYNPAANEYLVVWRGDDNTAPLVNEEYEIYAQRLSADSTPLGGRIRVSDMGPDGDGVYDAFGPSVAYNSVDGQYLVVWTANDNTGALASGELEIYGQRITAAGAEAGTDFRISQMGTDGNTNYFGAGASVAHSPASNQYLVAWRGVSPPLAVGEQEIFVQRVTAGGGMAGVNYAISEMGPSGDANYDALFPSVAYNSTGQEFLVVWQGDDGAPLANDEFEIYGQRLTSIGLLQGDDFRISDLGPDGNSAYDAGAASVAYNSGDNQYLVIWEGDDTAPLVDQEYEIFGQRLTAGGGALGANDFRISDMGPDGTGIFFAADARVAYNPDTNQYVVTWEGDDNTPPLVDEEFEIFGQQLDAAGAESGTNDFRISEMGPNADTSYSAGDPRIVYNAAADQYLVVWDGDDDTAPLVNNEREIFGRRLAELPPPEVPPGVPPPGVPPPSADTLAPQVLSLALTPTAFAAFPTGPSVRPARTRGTRVTYRLSEAATTTFRVQRVLPGRRVRGRCVRPTRANRDAPRCKRYRMLRGRFRHVGAAGVNRFKYSGRLAGRKLRPGSYRLVATAMDAAAYRSGPVRRPFRIVR